MTEEAQKLAGEISSLAGHHGDEISGILACLTMEAKKGTGVDFGTLEILHKTQNDYDKLIHKIEDFVQGVVKGESND